MANSFKDNFPYISFWVTRGGWIEIGDDECQTSFIRALDGGGMVWEGEDRYESVDEALKALEIGIRDFMKERGIDP